MSLFFFNLIKSFLNSFIIIPVGVTTKKKIIPIIIGAIKFPNKIPNLNHNLFKGVRIFEFKRPSVKNIIEIIKDHNLISLPFSKGHKAIKLKTTANTIPVSYTHLTLPTT